MSRRCHHHSILRANISMSIWCSLQALISLLIAEFMLPTAITGGQGPVSMLSAVVAHPWLLFNAVNNSIYWISLAFLLREPLGAVLIVVAFLVAALCVDPLQVALGLPTEHSLSWPAVICGALGALACTLDVSPATSAAVCRIVPPFLRRRLPAPVLGDETGTATPSTTAAADTVAPTSALATAGALAVLAACTAAGVTFMPVAESRAGLNALGYTALDQVLLPLTTLPLVAALASSPAACAMVGEPAWGPHAVAVPSFRALLARTLAELNAVPRRSAAPTVAHTAGGGSDVDAEALTHAPVPETGTGTSGASFSAVAASTGDPALAVRASTSSDRALEGTMASSPASPRAPSLVAEGDVAEMAEAEPLAPGSDAGSARRHPCVRRIASLLLCRGRSFWFTLIPFHGLEFARTIALFFLVTTYDAGVTYLTATLIRVGLVWMVALLACTALQDWVGIEASEARRALDPVSLAAKALGSVGIVAALAMQKGIW